MSKPVRPAPSRGAFTPARIGEAMKGIDLEDYRRRRRAEREEREQRRKAKQLRQEAATRAAVKRQMKGVVGT